MIQNYNKGDGKSGKSKKKTEKKIFGGVDSSCYRKSVQNK